MVEIELKEKEFYLLLITNDITEYIGTTKDSIKQYDKIIFFDNITEAIGYMDRLFDEEISQEHITLVKQDVSDDNLTIRNVSNSEILNVTREYYKQQLKGKK